LSKIILNVKLIYINPLLCIVQFILMFFLIFRASLKIPKNKLLTLNIWLMHVIEYYFDVNWNLVYNTSNNAIDGQ